MISSGSFFCLVITTRLIHGISHHDLDSVQYTKTIEEMAIEYDDDKNSMIAIVEKDNLHMYDDFYEELDNRVRIEQSLNMIFFGPPSSFMRLDAETILHIISNTKKFLIPTTRALLAWDIITDGKTAAFLQGREYLAFGSLLNVVPEEDLYYANFGDPSVLKYFSLNVLKLKKRKLGVLIAAYRRYFGDTWLNQSTYINELGHLLCGFPSTDLEKIPPKIFKELNVDVLTKLDKCDSNQTKTLYKIATHPDAYGEPYKWTSHEVYKLGALFACIPVSQISAIQLEAITTLSKDVLKNINQDKLGYFSKQQILRMNRKARRTYILRMLLRNSLDMSQLTKGGGQVTKPIKLQVLLLIQIILMFYNVLLINNIVIV